MRRVKKLSKFAKQSLTIIFVCAILLVPLKAGLLYLGVSFYVHLGLQIGTQFCPGMIFGQEIIVGARLSFFVALNVREWLVL
jgi:hypothetical protein